MSRVSPRSTGPTARIRTPVQAAVKALAAAGSPVRLRLPRPPSASRIAALALALAILVATGACGFRLRGYADIPPELNPMLIAGPPGSRVEQAILARLEGSQVRLAQSAKDARVIVRLANERESSRVVAVDRDGKVLARELFFGVDFEATAPDGKVLVPAQNVGVVRSYDNPDVEVLGKQEEAELILEDMVNDAADRILTRLRAALL